MIPELSKNKTGEIISYKDVTVTASCPPIPIFYHNRTFKF